MEQWLAVPEGDKKQLNEVEGAAEKEPVEVYAARYRIPAEDLCPGQFQDIQRHIDEILCEFEPGSSVLLFGSGHSLHANGYYERCSTLGPLHAMDLVPEASIALRPEIGFTCADICDYEFREQYDYIFTSHTLEHFTREVLLNVVIPKLRSAARKALVVLVPYGEHWAGEPSHCCRFYENDELAGLASRYKKIRDGQEIVYWLEGRG